uniref:Uncharacterized protein n=1 Tax=Noctiluca scintillans TaxID=2966 RepID=A0A7S1F8M2_NOCSC
MSVYPGIGLSSGVARRQAKVIGGGIDCAGGLGASRNVTSLTDWSLGSDLHGSEIGVPGPRIVGGGIESLESRHVSPSAYAVTSSAGSYTPSVVPSVTAPLPLALHPPPRAVSTPVASWGSSQVGYCVPCAMPTLCTPRTPAAPVPCLSVPSPVTSLVASRLTYVSPSGVSTAQLPRFDGPIDSGSYLQRGFGSGSGGPPVGTNGGFPQSYPGQPPVGIVPPPRSYDAPSFGALYGAPAAPTLSPPSFGSPGSATFGSGVFGGSSGLMPSSIR